MAIPIFNTKFVEEIWECLRLILNYGSEKIRFISPVICNNKIRAKILLKIKDYKGEFSS